MIIDSRLYDTDVSIYLVENASIIKEINEIMCYMTLTHNQMERARRLSLHLARNALKINEICKDYINLKR